MAGMGTARIVLPLFMGVAVAGAHMFLVSPLLPDIADEFARSTSEIGRAASAGSLGTAVTAALAVPVMDRFPRKLILIGALLALALALGLVAAAPTYATFTVAFALAGASIGVLLPTTYAMAADLTSAADRSRVLGLVLLGWSASYLIQPLVSKLGDTTGWRGAYGAVAAVALLAALLDMTLPARPAAGSGATLTAYADALRLPAVRPLLASCVCVMFCFYGTYPYWGASYRALHGGDASAASWLALCYGIGFILPGTLTGLIGRLSSWRVLIAGYLMSLVVYGALGWVIGSPGTFLVWCVVLGIVNNIMLTALVSSLASISSERRGSILAIYSATTYLGFTAGAASLGPIYERYGLGANGLAAAGAMVVAILFAGIAARAHHAKSRPLAKSANGQIG